MSFGDLTRINANVQSLRAYNQLQHTNSRLNDHQLRLATGKRINEAVDNSAGFAFSKKLEARIREYEGNGLNLSIAKRLVELSGGAIHVHGTRCKSSIFSVELPQGESAMTAAGGGGSSVPASVRAQA